MTKKREWMVVGEGYPDLRGNWSYTFYVDLDDPDLADRLNSEYHIFKAGTYATPEEAQSVADNHQRATDVDWRE